MTGKQRELTQDMGWRKQRNHEGRMYIDSWTADSLEA